MKASFINYYKGLQVFAQLGGLGHTNMVCLSAVTNRKSSS